MKKIALALTVIIGIGLSSCSKENDAKPETKTQKAPSLADKKDNTGWN